MDAFQLLKEDHRKVEQLFSQLESASGKAKLDVFKQIKTELELHTHIEEKIFYPALEEPEETHDLTLEAYEEHAVVKTLLKELSRARTANDEWEAQAKVLQENVEHHVEEEENELFQKAENALSEEELEDLSERMIAEKSRKAGSTAVKVSAAKKSSGSKKSAGKSKSASKNASASKGSSRSAAAKTARRSRSKKSAAKKR
ncbi:MAG TPA: hemerythrin domain-containing protein [Pyrinomonadaceae bacterium]|nr:hemerythrin domain-containing protein [Pyrinomonadaceae bacterium]